MPAKSLRIVRKNEDKIIAGMFTLLVMISFINETVYEKAGKFSSLLMFAVLAVLLFAHAGDMWKNKDIKVPVIVITGIIAFVNLCLLNSNKGAVLIPSDLMLIVLASDYIRLRERTALFITIVGSIFTIVWYVDVRWSYNFNMAGLTFMLFMIMGVIFLQFIREIRGSEYNYLVAVQLLMFVTSFIYATLYHSRCAMAGIAAFGLFSLSGILIRRSRVLFTILLILTTVGSICFTIVYIILAGKGINISFLYKDILSGRQQIWKELWMAFLERPFTGIGSSYELKSFDIFEVHNGFFDLLTVHGLTVFIPVFILILSALNKAWLSWNGQEGYASISHLAFAALFAMLVASFFENFFITPPYSAFFLCLLLMIRSEL